MDIKLHSYQEYAKDFIKTRPYCGLFLEMGLGKAIDDNAIIPTPNGFCKVGDIKPNDLIFGKNGKPTKVLATYKHKNKNAYQVTLKDKRTFVCCDEHLIPCISYTGAKQLKTIALKDMLDDYKSTTKQNSTKYKYRIPICDAVEYPTTEHVIHPYALGVLIGDGCLTKHYSSLTISSIDEDVIGKFMKLTNINNVHKNKHNFNWAFTCDNNANVVKKELTKLNLRGKKSIDKFIPQNYLIDSIENRKALLSGLLDTDGNIQYSRSNGTGSMHQTFSTMSLSLIHN